MAAKGRLLTAASCGSDAGAASEASHAALYTWRYLALPQRPLSAAYQDPALLGTKLLRMSGARALPRVLCPSGAYQPQTVSGRKFVLRRSRA